MKVFKDFKHFEIFQRFKKISKDFAKIWKPLWGFKIFYKNLKYFTQILKLYRCPRFNKDFTKISKHLTKVSKSFTKIVQRLQRF